MCPRRIHSGCSWTSLCGRVRGTRPGTGHRAPTRGLKGSHSCTCAPWVRSSSPARPRRNWGRATPRPDVTHRGPCASIAAPARRAASRPRAAPAQRALVTFRSCQPGRGGAGCAVAAMPYLCVHVETGSWSVGAVVTRAGQLPTTCRHSSMAEQSPGRADQRLSVRSGGQVAGSSPAVGTISTSTAATSAGCMPCGGGDRKRESAGGDAPAGRGRHPPQACGSVRAGVPSA